MKKRLWFILVPVLMLTLSACSDSVSDSEADLSAGPGMQMGNRQGGMHPMGGPAPNQGTAQFEIRWMENMIDHHHMAVMMGEICLDKAVHSELKTLCQNIITTQTQEIQEMQSWLLDWYGISYEPRMKPGDQRQMDKLASLNGAAFEIAFMEEMIRHHRMAIMEARMALRRAYHEELKQLAQTIIVTQSAEIQEMQTWLCQWFNRCKSPMMMH